MAYNPPSVRTRTVIETDTPGVLGWAGGDVGESGVPTTRPPSVGGGRGKVCWTAGTSTISSRDVRDGDAVELLHPCCHLTREEGWEGFHINKLPGAQQTKSPYMGRQRYPGRATVPSCKQLKESVRTERAAKLRTLHTRRRKRGSTGPGRASTSGVGGTRKDRRAGGHSRGEGVDRNRSRPPGDGTGGARGGTRTRGRG